MMDGKLQTHGRAGNVQKSENPAATSEQRQKDPNYFIRSPIFFLRRPEVSIGIARSSTHDTFRNRLYIFPYKLHIFQQLEDHDHTACNDFANWCIKNTQSDASFLNCRIYSDDVVSKKVRKSNHEQREIARDSEKLTECWARSVNQVIGPYYPDRQIVNSESCINI